MMPVSAHRGLPSEEVVREALARCHLRLDRSSRGPDLGYDFVARDDNHEFAVQVKSLAPFRARDLFGTVADTFLRLLRVQQEENLKPLLVICVDSANERILSTLSLYVRDYAQDLYWVLVDGSGWSANSLEEKERTRCASTDQSSIAEEGGIGWQYRRNAPDLKKSLQKRHESRDLFTPHSKWLLKTLLMAGITPAFWGGSKKRPLTISELAEVAEVSQSTTSRFVSELETHGHLIRGPEGLQMRNVHELLESWAREVNYRPGRRLLVKPLYPASPGKAVERLEKQLQQWQSRNAELSRSTVAVGSFYACRKLGVARSNVDTVRLYVASLGPEVLEALELVPASRGEHMFEIIEPRGRENIFKGMVEIDGLPVVDLLQCYLDVRLSAARGIEQSDFIYERILAPHFESIGWH